MNDAQPRDFEMHIRDVQARLIDSVRRAGIGRHPYSRIIEAQAAAIGIFPEFVQAVRDNRKPFSDEERRGFERALPAALRPS